MEDLLIFYKIIDTEEVINIPNNIPKSNTVDSSNKSGTDIGCTSSTPHSEGRIKGKKNQSSGKHRSIEILNGNNRDTNSPIHFN